MTIFAYTRVSTEEQTTDNQKKVIEDAGFKIDVWANDEGVSGSVKAFDRPAFKEMLSRAQENDTVIVTMIDRLGRSASDILITVEEFKARSIKLRVLQFDGVDVTSPMGKMLLTVMAACAELERNLLIERTKAGIARTASEGTLLGQPLKINPSDLRIMVAMHKTNFTYKEISDKFGVHPNTVTRNIQKWKDNLDGYEKEFNARAAQYSSTKNK
jgi:DNA invertase Pin-like site-specific DNA recombinase